MVITANKVFRATGAAAIAATFTPTVPVYLVCVKLHLSAAGGAAENFTITINSATGSAYDVELFSQDMTTVKDILWTPDQPIPILNNDPIDFAYNNANTRTYGLEVIYKTGD